MSSLAIRGVRSWLSISFPPTITFNFPTIDSLRIDCDAICLAFFDLECHEILQEVVLARTLTRRIRPDWYSEAVFLLDILQVWLLRHRLFLLFSLFVRFWLEFHFSCGNSRPARSKHVDITTQVANCWQWVFRITAGK
jgi:hypothetical protein